jgi:gliding motility-associated-like protein
MSTNLKDKDMGDIIRQKLDNINFEYDHSDWLKLEKDLPQSVPAAHRFFSGKAGYYAAVVSSVIIVSVVLTFILNQKNEETISTKSSSISRKENSYSENNRQISTAIIAKEEPADKILSIQKPSPVNDVIMTSGTKPENNITDQAIITQTNQTDNNKSDEPGINQGNNSQKVLNPDFRANITEGCEPLTVRFLPGEKSDSIFYLWKFGDGEISTDIAPVHTYKSYGYFTVNLTVKCFKSSSDYYIEKKDYIYVKQGPVADITTENNGYDYVFTSVDQESDNYKWLINGKLFATESSAEYQFTNNGNYNIELITCKLNGCCNTTLKPLNINIHHNILMPNSFTPNGDGRNDFFGPVGENLEEYQIILNIFNRDGNLVFLTSESSKPWDGKIMGTNQTAKPGIYVWKLFSKDKFGNTDSQKGYVNLLP